MSADGPIGYGTLTDEEVGPWGELVTQALHLKHDVHTEPWIRKHVGTSNWRVLRREGEVIAGLGLLESAHYLGGRPVSNAAVMCVAVPPHLRGQGLASRLLLEVLREQREKGTAVSSLYPASLRVYRRSGWERAGSYTAYRVNLADLPSCECGLTIRPVDDAHQGELRDIQGVHARESAGNMERTHPLLWKKLLKQPGSKLYGYLLDADEDPEGYVLYRQPKHLGEVQVLDWAARTPRAARCLLGFLGGLRSMASTALIPGAPVEPLFDLLPEQTVTVARTQDWMLRMIDVPAALEARGYHPEVEGEVHLEVEDELLEGNAGAFVVKVSEGRATVEEGGDARLRIGVRELAALFTGHRTPAEVALWGRIDGAKKELEALGRIFTGPRPWMVDRF